MYSVIFFYKNTWYRYKSQFLYFQTFYNFEKFRLCQNTTYWLLGCNFIIIIVIYLIYFVMHQPKSHLLLLWWKGERRWYIVVLKWFSWKHLGDTRKVTVVLKWFSWKNVEDTKKGDDGGSCSDFRPLIWLEQGIYIHIIGRNRKKRFYAN